MGIITFPKLNFTPKSITVWNITPRDLKEEYEADNNEEPWDDSWVRYTYEGVLLTAVYDNDMWIAQSIITSSGEIALSNASLDSIGGVTLENGFYKFSLSRYDYGSQLEDLEYYDVTNTQFNYIICG
jgi:hypothetical protein